MSRFVKQLHTDIDVEQLKNELLPLLSYQQPGSNQLCLFSRTGNDNWSEGAGRTWVASQFATINKSLCGTYTEEILNRYKKYYRWRLCTLDHTKSQYTIHRDAKDLAKRNFRIHIPLVTNPHARMLFFPGMTDPADDVANAIMHRFMPGSSYLVNTTKFHTAVNFSPSEPRLHIIGEIFYGW